MNNYIPLLFIDSEAILLTFISFYLTFTLIILHFLIKN